MPKIEVNFSEITTLKRAKDHGPKGELSRIARLYTRLEQVGKKNKNRLRVTSCSSRLRASSTGRPA